MVQRKVLVPVESTVTLELARLALAKVPAPVTTLQIPPVAAVAARVVVEEQIV